MLADGKIQALNSAGRGLLALLASTAAADDVDVRVRRMAAGDHPMWLDPAHVAAASLPWTPVSATERASSELGAAVHLAMTDQLARHAAEPWRDHALIVVTDGMPSDLARPTFAEVTTWFNAEAALAATTRVAVLIGRDADRLALHAFVSDPMVDLLEARRIEVLAERLMSAGRRVTD